MRVNVYAEEMTDRVEIIEKDIDGQKFTGLRIYLELPVTIRNAIGGSIRQVSGPFVHRPGDDDSSAVTFWGKRDLRDVLRKALTELDRHYAESASPPRVPGTGLPMHQAGQWEEVPNACKPMGVESGPGQPIDSGVVDKAVAWDQCQRSHQRGFRAGIEAAANWHMEAAAEWETADISDADRLKARYRELVKIAHPDRGGDPARFNEITDAIRRTREERA